MTPQPSSTRTRNRVAGTKVKPTPLQPTGSHVHKTMDKQRPMLLHRASGTRAQGA